MGNLPEDAANFPFLSSKLPKFCLEKSKLYPFILHFWGVQLVKECIFHPEVAFSFEQIKK